MQIHLSQLNDPTINLATEEYLFRNYSEEIIILYHNRPSIVVGKHQNVLSEVNFPFCFLNSIPVIRRISGGGTVYHGEGNLNFSFILSREKSGLNYFENLVPLQKFFKEMLNLEVEISPRNDLWLYSKKISGTAEHVFKDRVLHHGTLLYNANLGDLRKAIHKSGDYYKGKAVNSVRSETTNIANHLETPPSFQEFYTLLSEFLKGYFNADELLLTKKEYNEIREIANTKYNTREWNFAYPKKYSFEKSTVVNGKNYKVALKIENGLISESNILINGSPAPTVSLKGIVHYPENISKALNETDLWEEIKDEFLEMFF